MTALRRTIGQPDCPLCRGRGSRWYYERPSSQTLVIERCDCTPDWREG